MCYAWSGIVGADKHVYWKFGMDSHENLIKEFRLVDDLKKICRVEIRPKNGNYLFPDEYIFQVDEKEAPEWLKQSHEKACWAAQKKWLAKLDKVLIRKKIIHPFNDIEPPKEITEEHMKLLKEWASVWASVRDSVGDSMWASVWASVRDSVGDSVWDSVRDSVGDSVWDSMWASVRDSVRDSMWASVWAYTGSFFILPRRKWQHTEKIKCKGYPFASAVKLWEMGLVPSFDGKILRLHGGEKGKVLWEGKI
jgi:hypothetical protein